MKSSKIEVDIVSDTGISVMLLLVMITKMMIILLLVLLLLLLATNESNNCNCNNNVLIIKIIIKMKSVCALKWKTYIFLNYPKKKTNVFLCLRLLRKKTLNRDVDIVNTEIWLKLNCLFLFFFCFIFDSCLKETDPVVTSWLRLGNLKNVCRILGLFRESGIF